MGYGPSFLWALFIDIFVDAVFAVSVFFGWSAANLYSPSLCGMVAIVQPFGSWIVHIPLLNKTEYPPLSNLLMEIKVNAIPGACIAFLNVTFVFCDPFGSSMCKSPIPTAVKVLPSAIVISR